MQCSRDAAGKGGGGVESKSSVASGEWEEGGNYFLYRKGIC